jgi:hypothetical protein
MRAALSIAPRRDLETVVDAIANKAAAFKEMQFLRSCLTPAIHDFRIVIVDGLFNLRRRFGFVRRRLRPCAGYAQQNNAYGYHRSNRNAPHQLGSNSDKNEGRSADL